VVLNRFKVSYLFILVAALFFIISPGKSFAADLTGIVNGDSVNIRSGGGLTYDVISKANTGDTFTVLSEVAGWVKVKLPDGRDGWIADFLIDIQRSAIVLSDSLSVYEEGSTRTAVIGTLTKNDPVTILKEINGWYQIKSDKIYGWVYGNLLISNYTVSATAVNVYSDASVNVSVIDTISKGDTGQILKEINGWYFIQYGNSQGWIYYKHLTDGSPAPAPVGTPAIVLTQDLKVYQQESTRSSVIGTLKKNEAIKFYKEINGWYQISSQSINGWVYGGILKSSFTVSASLVNIYQEPSLRATLLNQLKKSDTGTILQEINGWYYIKSGTKEGWIYYKHITDGSPTLITFLDNAPGIVTANDLKVYKEASTRTSVIGTLSKDTPVTMVKLINGWYYIQSAKVSGWVYGSVLKSDFTVTASSLYIYQEASVNTPVTDSLSMNDTGTILKEINGWYYIQSGSKEGWIYSKHLTDGSPAPTVSLITRDAIVLPASLAVYKEASTRTAIIGQLVKDQPVTITKMINGWYHITSTSLDGWVYGNLLDSNVKTTVNHVDVYLNPTTRTTIVDTLSANTNIKIVKELNGWYNIQFAEKEGWVYKTHLEKGSPVTPTLNGKMLIASNLYYEPSTTSTIVGMISVNQEVIVTREVNNMYAIESNGIKGWVPVTAVNIKPLAGKVIVLDAGHGGYDGGATGVKYNTAEKDMTLQTVKLLSTKLTALGAKVILTRSTDVYIKLEDRVKVSIDNKADAFVSIHYNSSEANTASGLESFYYHTRDIALAMAIQASLIENINLRDRKAYFNDLHVLRENTQPSTLVELGFLSNPTEEALIRTQSYQETATSAIADGILAYFKGL
jgi:N-acetylmuramoyl-L-alanine amidase